MHERYPNTIVLFSKSRYAHNRTLSLVVYMTVEDLLVFRGRNVENPTFVINCAAMRPQCIAT